jgi:hypothetical protein
MCEPAYSPEDERIIAERSEREGATWASCTAGLKPIGISCPNALGDPGTPGPVGIPRCPRCEQNRRNPRFAVCPDCGKKQ